MRWQGRGFLLFLFLVVFARRQETREETHRRVVMNVRGPEKEGDVGT